MNSKNQNLKKRIFLSIATNVAFPITIFIFLAKLMAYIEQYRKSFVAHKQLSFHIIVTAVIMILLSIAYGFILSKLIRKTESIDSLGSGEGVDK